jgi:hypothetical protein
MDSPASQQRETMKAKASAKTQRTKLAKIVARLRIAVGVVQYLGTVLRQYHLNSSPEWDAARRGDMVLVPYPMIDGVKPPLLKFKYNRAIPAALNLKCLAAHKELEAAIVPALKLCQSMHQDATFIYRLYREAGPTCTGFSDYSGIIASLDNLSLHLSKEVPPLLTVSTYKTNPTDEAFVRKLRVYGKKMVGQDLAVAAVGRYDGESKAKLASLVRAGVLTNEHDGQGYGLPEWGESQD